MTEHPPDRAQRQAKPEDKKSRKDLARERSAAALRENLKRRKTQARTQANNPTDTSDLDDGEKS